MKTLVSVFSLFLALALNAAEPVKKSWWTDFSVTPFGAIIHPDFSSPVWGSGLDLGYNINKTVSAHLSGVAFEFDDWKGPAIDELSLTLRADLIRYDRERLVFYGFGGGDRSFHYEDWAFGVGLGAELRLARNYSLGVDSRIRAWFDQDKDLLTRAFLSYRF